MVVCVCVRAYMHVCVIITTQDILDGVQIHAQKGIPPQSEVFDSRQFYNFQLLLCHGQPSQHLMNSCVQDSLNQFNSTTSDLGLAKTK